MSDVTLLPPATAPLEDAAPSEPGFDWRKALATTEARLAILVLASLCLLFSPFIKKLSAVWFEADSLYSHGPLIPIMAGYIVYERWPKLRNLPVRGVTWAIVPMVLVMYLVWFASRTVMVNTLGAIFMALISLSVLFIAGWRWFFGTLGAVAYLAFSIPFWTNLVDRMTQPLQVLSTDMAVRILDLSGLHPLRTDPTTVYLDHFQLNVAAACSGAKLTLALTAFASFFTLLGRGRWYSVVALFVLLVPFSLAVNGLRIALIGIIGNSFGQQAGMAFHDYGGYVVLVVCLYLLSQITRLLGFK